MRAKRIIRLAVCAAVGLASFPAVARAGSVELYDDPYSDYAVLNFSAGFNETNAVTLDGDSRRARVTDGTSPLFTGPGCISTGPNAAVCTVSGGRRLTNVQSFLGDRRDRLRDNLVGVRDDTFNFFGPSHYHDGGEGADELVGSDGDPDYLRGGNGSDLARGRGGDDVLIEESFFFGGGETGDDRYLGGLGDDTLTGGAGADFLDGGPGIDRVEYTRPLNAGDPGVRIDLRGTTFGNGQPGEDDILANDEDAIGTHGNDTLIGSAGGNVLDGGPGDDTITGEGGADSLFGRGGADDLQAQDGASDRVSCGGPNAGDRAAVDAIDAVFGCPAEGAGLTTLAAPRPVTPPVSSPDEEAPAIALTVARRVKPRTLLTRGLRARVSSTDAVPNRVTATLWNRPRIAQARAGDLILAQRSASFLRRTTIRLRPARRIRAAVRRGARLRLRVVVQDPAGNRSTRTVRVRVT